MDDEQFDRELKAKADAVKADIKAGRYRHGQLHPEITAETEAAKLEKDSKTFVMDSMSSYIEQVMLESMIGRGHLPLDLTIKHHPELKRGLHLDLESYDLGDLLKERKTVGSFTEYKSRWGGTKSGRYDGTGALMVGLDIGRPGGDHSAMVIMDEAHNIKMDDWDENPHTPPIFITADEPEEINSGPTKPYWTQPIPGQKNKNSTAIPSEAKRDKLRKKRRK